MTTQRGEEDRLTVLFLGHRYNPISVACLQALLEAGTYTVSIGVHAGEGHSLRRTIRRIWRTKGARAVLVRVMDVLIATTRMRLRRSGVPLRGFCSLDEVALVYPCGRFRFDRINAPASVQEVQRLRPDVIVVAAFGQILKAPIIAIPTRGCINVHPSLLPKYRGPNPLYWALRHHESTTGVTIHYIDTGIDSGDIILQREIPIPRGATELRLRATAARVAAQLLDAAMRLIAAGCAPRAPQRAEDATYFSVAPHGQSVL